MVRLRFRPGSVLSLAGFLFSLSSAGLLSWRVRTPAVLEHRLPLPGDADADGLPDRLEDELLARHAPDALLSPDDLAGPASLAWIRGRSTVSRVAFEQMGALVAAPVPDAARPGSDDPSDWTVYGHAYPRDDGGVELQYWLFFPFNDGPLFFDHDGDWEHVSVTLGPDLEPVTFAPAAHDDNAPGPRLPWSEVARDGTHPLFFVAAGTHAAYADRDEAPFWERLAPGTERWPVAGSLGRWWRPGRASREGGSPLLNVGERGASLLADGDDAAFFAYRGLWGAAVRAWSGAAPYGPPYQRGFCVDAGAGSCR